MGVKKAGIGKRLLATIIDYGIVYFIAFIPYYIFYSIYSANNANVESALYTLINAYASGNYNQMTAAIAVLLPLMLVLGGSLLVVQILYMVLLPTLWKGQTLGRKAAKIKVINKANLGKPSFLRLLFREVICFSLIVGFLGWLYFVTNLIILSMYGDSVTDYMSSTFSVDMNTAYVINVEENNDNQNSQFDDYNNFYESKNEYDNTVDEENDTDSSDDSSDDEYMVF